MNIDKKLVSGFQMVLGSGWSLIVIGGGPSLSLMLISGLLPILFNNKKIILCNKALQQKIQFMELVEQCMMILFFMILFCWQITLSLAAK